MQPMTLDANAAAAFLGMSRARLRREVAAGTVPGPLPLIGNKKLWSRPILERWLAGDQTPAGDVDPIMAAIETSTKGPSR